MSTKKPSDDELRILTSLTHVCCQYMSGSFDHLEHGFLSAGEHAVSLLEEYGLMLPDGAGGSWTTKGNLLQKVEDPDPAYIDEIRSQFHALPSGQLRAAEPDERGHQHDVHIDFLRLWFLGRAISRYAERPKTARRPSPDRLYVEARLGLVDATTVVRGEILTIGEVEAFRNQLAALVQRSSSKARLVAYQDSIDIDLSVNEDESVGGNITVRNPLYRHSTTVEVKIRSVDSLAKTIDQFDEVLGRLLDSTEGF